MKLLAALLLLTLSLTAQTGINVWANTTSGIYHCAGSKAYGKQNNREPQVRPIKRVLACIVSVALFCCACWSCFLKAPGAFSDGYYWRGFGYLVLFLLCFGLCVPFADTGFCGWSGWIQLLGGGEQ